MLGANKLFTTVQIKSGNNVVYESMPVEELMWSERNRYFKGYPGIAILVFNFSRQPTMSNAYLGGIDFSLLVSPISSKRCSTTATT